MAKVLMLPLPTYGHIHPTLPLAQELVARGEDVCYCLPEEFKPTIAWTRATCVPYQLSGRGFRWRRLSCEELFVWQPLHMAVLSLEALPQLLEIARDERPDYLLYDASCLWGRLLGHLLHLPAIRFNTTFVLGEQLGKSFWTLLDQAERVSMPRLAIGAGEEGEITFQSAVEQLCSIYHLSPIELKSFFDHAERLNLVPIPPAFQPGVEHFDERFLFPGPTVGPRPEASDFPLAQLKAQPTLYISMGSVCHHEVEFFKTCFAAFGRTQGPTKRQGWPPFASRRSGKRVWQVILATGTSDPARLGPVPENFIARSSVPQLALLQQTSVFVTHGGMNSVLEALSFGVPLVVVPQMMEQVITARRVEELGLGRALEKSAVTVEALTDAVMDVASDQELHRRVQQMRDALRQMGGAHQAADAVLHFSRTDGRKSWSWPTRGNLLRGTSKEKTGRECISVVIPTYNRREMLVNTLNAFANQDLPLEYEVLVCDDGSSDETAEDVTRMMKENRFSLRYLRHERAGFRLAATRNMGIAAAKGSLIVFTDDDIMPSPSYLSAHYEAHHTPRTVVIGYRYALLPDQERGCTMLGQDARDKEFAAFPDLRGPMWMLMYGCNFSVEHALLGEVGSFDEHFEGWGAEDLELAYRFARSGARFVLEKKAYGWHQPDPGPVSPPMPGAEVVPPNVISHLTNLSRFRSKYPEDPGLQQILSRLIAGLEQERSRILARTAE